MQYWLRSTTWKCNIKLLLSQFVGCCHGFFSQKRQSDKVVEPYYGLLGNAFRNNCCEGMMEAKPGRSWTAIHLWQRPQLTSWLAVTNLSPTEARVLCPCIAGKVGPITLWARKLPSVRDNSLEGSIVSPQNPTVTTTGDISALVLQRVSIMSCIFPYVSQQDT